MNELNKNFKILNILTVLLFILSIKSVSSENSSYLILKINNQIITNIDIDNEKNYLLAINENLISLDNLEMLSVAKESLIREKIKKIELEKYYDLQEYSKYIESLLGDFITKLNFENIENLENYFLSKNVKLETVKKKLNIEALWNELIFNSYGKQVEIDENKLNSIIKNQDYKQEKEFFLLSEIVFEANTKDEIASKHNKILKSIDSIGFGNTANIYSLSESAKFNGDVGWIDVSQLQVNVYDKVKKLEEGQYSDLINVPGGFLILYVGDIKKEIIEIDEEKKLTEMIKYEKDRQLNEFSFIYYQRIKKNSLIDEK